MTDNNANNNNSRFNRRTVLKTSTALAATSVIATNVSGDPDDNDSDRYEKSPPDIVISNNSNTVGEMLIGYEKKERSDGLDELGKIQIETEGLHSTSEERVDVDAITEEALKTSREIVNDITVDHTSKITVVASYKGESDSTKVNVWGNKGEAREVQVYIHIGLNSSVEATTGILCS